MDLINQTGVPRKNKGDGLSSGDVNSINSTVNACVSAVNSMLSSNFNLNAETGQPDRRYTFAEAVSQVPPNRRIRGLRIKFNNSQGYYEELIFVGDAPEEPEWSDPNMWSAGGGIIDGGEW